MAIEFYDRDLEKVKFDESKVEKVTVKTWFGTRYALKVTTDDGRNLTFFVTKEYWDNLDVDNTENEIFSPEEGDDLPR